jgi:16S rRNA (guanine1207-N2)-methyltransferase
MPHHEIDPAIRLLSAADTGTGKRALLILAGTGELAAGIAPRYEEVICHNSECGKHAAALGTVQRLRLGNVRCLVGDLPCAEGGSEGALAGPRFPADHFDLIAFRLGKGTAQLNAMLIESFRLLAPGGHLLVAGHNQEGIKSFAKRGEAYFGNLALEGLKSSCRLLRFRKDGKEPAEHVEDPEYFKPVRLELELPGGIRIGYDTKPGIFAYRATDPGTALLATHLPSCVGKTVMDLGCGSGALSLAAFKLGAAAVLATDNSAVSIACAQANFAAQGWPGKTLCADMADGAPEDFDLILANPPFHRDSETDYGLPERVVQAVFRHLRPGGEAYLVANQFLDYPTPAKKLFQAASILGRAHGYTIHHMVKAV